MMKVVVVIGMIMIMMVNLAAGVVKRGGEGGDACGR